MPKIGSRPAPCGAAPAVPGPEHTPRVVEAAKRVTQASAGLNRRLAHPHDPDDHHTFGSVRVCLCICPGCWPDDGAPCPWTLA